MSSCEMVSNLLHLQETATFNPEEQALFFREFQAKTKWAWSVRHAFHSRVCLAFHVRLVLAQKTRKNSACSGY